MTGSERLQRKFNRKFSKFLSTFWYLNDYCQVSLERKTKFDPPDWRNSWLLSVYHNSKSVYKNERAIFMFLGNTFREAKEKIDDLTEKEVNERID